MCYASNRLRHYVRHFGTNNIHGSVARNEKKRPFAELRGPSHIPYIGFINDILNLGHPKDLHRTITKYHKQFGQIFKIKISTIDAVFISNPEMMRNVFAYEGKFPRHPLPNAWTYYNQKHNCKRGLFFMDGEEWLHYRQILNNLILRDANWMAGPVEKICDRTINSMLDDVDFADGKHLIRIDNMEEKLYKWSIEVILSIMLGNSYSDETAKRIENLVKTFAGTVYNIFLYSSKLMTVPPKIADILQLPAWKRFEQVVPETLEIASTIINNILDEAEHGDGLLVKLQKNISSREVLIRIFADLMIAAGDTTAFSTLWSTYLLAKNLEVQEQVRSGIGEGELESSLIRGTVREALRLYPVAPFIGRFLDSDAVIGGYCLPANTLVLLSLHTAGRDADNFYSPLKFLPQRWVRDSNKGYPFSPCSVHASLPFAIGSRSCIGRKIALYQMHVLLTKVSIYFLHTQMPAPWP
ncbi:cytochrome P450 315a1, mitochondrial isoform X2 [Uranotaenia lowii]|uniref:cytochrome P450 315a1, mitochondrial isoform X2 n=1 Tax=Uranotaenia lowii TaxID=190385 RepID=UPI00247958AD|nr:cytochrome P450 315a1, mitochondrial isoform X2 [Uranotaenia lowii]